MGQRRLVGQHRKTRDRNSSCVRLIFTPLQHEDEDFFHVKSVYMHLCLY